MSARSDLMEKRKRIDQAREAWRVAMWLILGFAAFSLLQFLVVTSICLGTYDGPTPIGKAFLSELGRSNLPLGWLFNGSVILLGTSAIVVFGSLFVVDRRQSLSMRFACGFGIVSALGLICLGLSPIDRQYIAHMASMALWVFPMLYTVVPFFFSASRHPRVSFWFIAVSLAIFLLMLIFLSIYRTNSFHTIEKMMVVCGVVWYGFILWYVSILGFDAINEWQPSELEIAEGEAEAYFSTYERVPAKRSAR